MNRYSRISVSDFNPMSLDEMMLVPLAKQKQHDDILNNQDEIENRLNNLKRLNPDDEIVNSKVSSYKNRLDEISNLISTEGINRETSRNFRKLFSEYNQDVSESGDLGKIQNNYILAKKKEADFVKQMQKLGHTQDYINKQLEKTYGSFKGTIGENGYNEFGNFEGSNYYDPQRELDGLLSRAGAIGMTVGGGDSDITYDASTGFYKISKPGSKSWTTNKQNILDGLNSHLLNYQTGDRAKFLEGYGISQEDFRNEMTNRAKTYFKRQEKTDKGSSYYQQAAKESSTSKNKKEDSKKLYYNEGSTSRYFAGKSFDEIKSTIKDLKDKGNDVEARRLDLHFKNVQNTFNNTPLAKNLKRIKEGYIDDNGNEVPGLRDKLNEIKGKYDFMYIVGSGNPEVKSNEDITIEELLSDDVRIFDTKKYIKDKSPFGYKNPQLVPNDNGEEYTTLLTKKGRRVIPTEMWNEIKGYRNHQRLYDQGLQYSIDDYVNNTKEYQFGELESSNRTSLNEVTKRTLKNSGANGFKISGGYTINKENNKTTKFDESNPLTPDKEKAIFNLLQHSDTKVEFNKYTVQNHTGNPAINITLTPGKENELKETMNLWVELPQLANNQGTINSSNQVFIDSLRDYGGVDGNLVASKIEQRAKYNDIQPTFSNDFHLSDRIKEKINPTISPYFSDKDLDITKIGDNYTIEVRKKGSNNYESLNWGDFLQIKDKNNTRDALINLTPTLGKKLIEDIKRVTGEERSLSSMTEEEIDNMIYNLATNKFSITADDFYDLMDLISK